MQRRYDEWAIGIKKKYGSVSEYNLDYSILAEEIYTELTRAINVVNYLLNYRLQWGKPDTLSLLTSVLDDEAVVTTENGERELYPTPEYFKADIPFDSELICIIQNDWPYSGMTVVVNSRISPRVANGTL